MNLRQHINTNHDGNVTAFARSISTDERLITYQQVLRYIKSDGIWFNGRVYCPKTTPDTK